MLSKDPKIIKKTRISLENLFNTDLNSYIDLFFHEKETDLKKEIGAILLQTGLIRKSKKGYLANVMVFPFKGKFIVTDFLLSYYKKKNERYLRGVDDVWVMFPHETLLFIDKLPDIKGKMALDIASGSGAISLFLADKFEKVYSIDINPKAVNYAKFNAILNNLENKIVNKESDMFEAVEGMKFDFICWNGPTIALPEVTNPSKVYPLYAYGGYDGARFTKNFINEMLNFVNPNFLIRWWDGTLGNSQTSVVEDYLKRKLSNLNLKIKIEFLNKRRGVSLKEYDRLYEKYCLNKFDFSQRSKERERADKNWLKKLHEQKLNKVYISLITISPSKKFQISYKDTNKTYVSAREVFGFEWHFASKNWIKKYLLQHN